MKWVNIAEGCERKGGGRQGGGDVSGILFGMDKAGQDEDGNQRYTLRVRIGKDALRESRLQPGDYMTVEFAESEGLVRVRRETDAKNSKRWKLVSCGGKNSHGGALYFKTGLYDKRWLDALFVNGKRIRQFDSFIFDDGLICEYR